MPDFPKNYSAQKILENIDQVIVGKRTAIELTVIALLCGGHILIEDVPGVGKTVLAKSLARSTNCQFKRLQFTPDLLPSDVTGSSIYNWQTGGFQFHPGPVLTQILLIDEINRASPKAQSALLEAMDENSVSVDGVTHTVPQPFFVLATQNPIEFDGTFPLPEGQLDRFLLRIHLGYPSFDDEVTIIERQQLNHPIDTLEPVITPEGILTAQQIVRQIHVDGLINRYIVALVDASRKHRDIELGASPRASLALSRTSQALAFLRGRDFVIPDDVKELAVPVMAHRIATSSDARIRGQSEINAITELLGAVPVPGLPTITQSSP